MPRLDRSLRKEQTRDGLDEKGAAAADEGVEDDAEVRVRRPAKAEGNRSESLRIPRMEPSPFAW
jgi:hypothetical protein